MLKRLAELCMQGIYNSIDKIEINFSIVRFGNVGHQAQLFHPKQISGWASYSNSQRCDTIFYDNN